eukprot:TRINITY_DN18391_c0_g2_i1.p2 TRINITY_DN18391_c0_g2~~TRINITY_DN18391_c0_g2_i1.p2  ORF type:complete len:121 (+),score=30.56 TRINITY_DN18391_c0_g2_i1:24-365(+)
MDGCAADPPPARAARAVDCNSSMQSWDAKSSAGGMHPNYASFRWPVVAEILRNLPPEFVMSLEPHTAAGALHPLAADLDARAAPGVYPPPQGMTDVDLPDVCRVVSISEGDAK